MGRQSRKIQRNIMRGAVRNKNRIEDLPWNYFSFENWFRKELRRDPKTFGFFAKIANKFKSAA